MTTKEPSNRRTILVVEDDSILLWVLVKKFEKEGFRTLHADNGETGLATALREHPDLILLDIIMPKMDGITMLRKMRADAWGSTVPVIVLTNLSRVMTDGNISGDIGEYLVKTEWDIGDVVRKVRETLANHLNS
ncbi:MAG: response regulator [Patescibacteria group bacterium]|nr:response regulator [Patescibacteria group bacterium]MDD5716155.1 response regulator [Patescibacteria group bacterium]